MSKIIGIFYLSLQELRRTIGKPERPTTSFCTIGELGTQSVEVDPARADCCCRQGSAIVTVGAGGGGRPNEVDELLAPEMKRLRGADRSRSISAATIIVQARHASGKPRTQS